MTDELPSFIDHVSIGTNDFEAATAFYDKAMATIGDGLAKLTGDTWYSSKRVHIELVYEATHTFEGALPEPIERQRGGRG